MSVGPTLTAHPPETERVTVLEIHRRIYQDLTKQETQRWTRRERETILGEIEGDIDLLWWTAKHRPERPTLTGEIDWDPQFVHDSIFDAALKCSTLSSMPHRIVVAHCQTIRPASGSTAGSAATATATRT
ncbi:MAG: phosphoenolpyruvate carboxylase [Boseongicola sp. SB0677_bin_26]|nr:phosphoenolpyruvate carboxylase [Boseongicola sp. SB0665_bin_10]MYG25470.1 phosphoenolpyruvate carboxylase [Boseongicola sp. SB0677_bin_26]